MTKDEAFRRFFRREGEELVSLKLDFGPLVSLVAHMAFRGAVNDPGVEVVKLVAYQGSENDFLDLGDSREVQATWETVKVAHDREEEVVIDGHAFLLHGELELPVVIQITGEQDGRITIELTVRGEDRTKMGRLVEWLKEVSRKNNPYQGKLLELSPDGLTFLPPPGVQREDVILPPQILEELERSFTFLAPGVEAPVSLRHRAVLLAGPPGVGKTMACKWLAGTVASTVLWVTPGTIWNVGPEEVFRVARRFSPSLLILEDLDVAAGSRDGAQPLGDLLVQLDGFEPLHGVGIVATTNRPEVLDPALDPERRPGRFDRMIVIGPPEAGLRKRLLARLIAGGAARISARPPRRALPFPAPG